MLVSRCTQRKGRVTMENTVRTITTASGRELAADIEWDYSGEQRGYMVRLADVTTVNGWEIWLRHEEAMKLAEHVAELACDAAIRNGQDAEVQHTCSSCRCPVIRNDSGGWVHAEMADAAFCELIMNGGGRDDS